MLLSIFIFWTMFIKLASSQREQIGDGHFSDCGNNKTAAVDTITIPVFRNISEVCSFRIIRPKGEKIFIKTDMYFCCYQIVAHDGISEEGPIILNLTKAEDHEGDEGHEIPAVLSVNTSVAFITFTWIQGHQVTEAPSLYLQYFTEGPPDYKGSRFVIAKASFLYISTMKSSVLFKLPCKNIDKPETLITSLGKTFELDIPIQLRAERQTNQDMPDIDRSTNGDKPYIGGSTRIDYDGIALEAIDDIIVFGVKLNYTPTLFMPSDVMGTDYFIISPGQGEIVIMDTKYGNSRITVNITFPECLGNCSLPVCATQNITRHLSGCQTRIMFTCQTDLSGVKVTSNSPITVTVDDGFQLLPMPPIKAWGKQFVLFALPNKFQVFSAEIMFKIIISKSLTNITVKCFKTDSNTEDTFQFFLKNPGDYLLSQINDSTNCWISANKPILPVYIMRKGNETAAVIPPIEQYSNEYLLPAELCSDNDKYKNTLIIIISTKQINGLRVNGLPIAELSDTQLIGKTGYSSIQVNLTEPKLRIIRHISSNIGFGAFLVCQTNSDSHIVPLGMRMAPIAEGCEPTTSVLRDILDKYCDGLLDEDICSLSDDVTVGNYCVADSLYDVIPCLGYTDSNGISWETTAPKSYNYQQCPNTTGTASNYCELKEVATGLWKGPDTNWCVNEFLNIVSLKFKQASNGTNNTVIADILNETLVITRQLIETDNLSAGSLRSVVNNLDLATTIVDDRATGVTAPEREAFISLVDGILSDRTINTWEILQSKVTSSNYAAVLMEVVSRFGLQILTSQSGESVIFVRENIVLETRRGNIDDVVFPNNSVLTEDYKQTSLTNSSVNAILFLSKETIRNNLEGSIDYTAVYYRTVAKILSLNRRDNIGSDIVAFSLPNSVSATNLSPPVQIKFEHAYNNGTNSTCVFWDFDEGTGGAWSAGGCYAEYRNDTFSSCRCNHLTNFAVLISTSAFSVEDTLALTFITWPGCVISIICLLLTIASYIYFWRILKSDKAKILISLCVVLLLAYVILLSGLEQTNNSTGCSVIAICLHYLFLAALCLMVAEGFEIALTVLRAFPPKRSKAALLLSFGFVSPLVIVTISMASTRLTGYGTEKYCWLSVSNGLIYAFLVPCIVVVLTNLTISVLVVRKMYTTKFMMKKETKDKIKAGVRSIAVLSPILGLTWLFGILAFHRHLIVFSYLFTIFNTLQGLFIFIFHCLMNNKIQQAVKKQHERFAESHPWARSKKEKKHDLPTISDTVGSTKNTEETTVF